jgi:hypothetical protein
MPIQQLKLYDIIVDTIPGVYGLLCLYLILPAEVVSDGSPLSGGITTGALILAIAYVFGRIIHSLSGSWSDFLNYGVNELEERLMPVKSLSGILFLEFRKIMPVERATKKPSSDVSQRVWSWFDVDRPNSMSRTGEMGPVKLGPLPIEVEDSVQARYDVYKYTVEDTLQEFGFSELYQTNSLYQRYNVLTTFFRNMAFLAWCFFASTAAHYAANHDVVPFFSWTFHSIIPNYNGTPYWTEFDLGFAVPVLSFLVAVIFSRELYSYSKKRNRYFWIDFYKELKKEKS